MEIFLKIYLALSPVLALLFIGTALTSGFKKACTMTLFCIGMLTISSLATTGFYFWIKWIAEL